MDVYRNKLHLSSEHKEFAKDVTNMVIGYTPISGVIATINFGQKWLSKKRMPHRIARYMEKKERKNFIKTRSRRILISRSRGIPLWAA
jgi:hypothetical protein